MQRLEENRDVEQRKRDALGKSQPGVLKQPTKSNGYQLFHLILVALLSLLIGAVFTNMKVEQNAELGGTTGDI